VDPDGREVINGISKLNDGDKPILRANTITKKKEDPPGGAETVS
jgi:hypothetical protein